MTSSDAWRIAGTYYEFCNCHAVCPCRRLDGKPGGRSTFRLCQFLLSWHVADGFAGATSLAGRSVVMAGFYDNEVKGAPWTVSLYVDEQAAEPSFAALSEIFLGKRGGNILFTANIFDVVAVRRAAIALDHTKHRKRILVKDFATAEVESLARVDGVVSCGIPGHDHPGVEFISRSAVGDPPLAWHYEGRCGFATDFDYRS